MRKLCIIFFLLFLLHGTVFAQEIEIPPAPNGIDVYIPPSGESFGKHLFQMFLDMVQSVRPDLRESLVTCCRILVAVLFICIIQSSGMGTGNSVNLIAALVISIPLFNDSYSMIRLAVDTITQISEYGKLFLPVMTSILASQGGISTSAALYSGTIIFDVLFGKLVSGIIIPMVYLYLALSVANTALGEHMLKSIRDGIKWLMTWVLKTLLYVYTGYIAITGVVSGTTDALSLKTAKMTISGFVPVVGSILSDASEAILVGAATVKNTAGIYGLFAVLGLCLHPFLKISVHYLLLKGAAVACEVFSSKEITELIRDFSAALGFLLAMTGVECLTFLISIVCFMKGAG